MTKNIISGKWEVAKSRRNEKTNQTTMNRLILTVIMKIIIILILMLIKVKTMGIS